MVFMHVILKTTSKGGFCGGGEDMNDYFCANVRSRVVTLMGALA